MKSSSRSLCVYFAKSVSSLLLSSSLHSDSGGVNEAVLLLLLMFSMCVRTRDAADSFSSPPTPPSVLLTNSVIQKRTNRFNLLRGDARPVGSLYRSHVVLIIRACPYSSCPPYSLFARLFVRKFAKMNVATPSLWSF